MYKVEIEWAILSLFVTFTWTLRAAVSWQHIWIGARQGRTPLHQTLNITILKRNNTDWNINLLQQNKNNNNLTDTSTAGQDLIFFLQDSYMSCTGLWGVESHVHWDILSRHSCNLIEKNKDLLCGSSYFLGRRFSTPYRCSCSDSMFQAAARYSEDEDTVSGDSWLNRSHTYTLHTH